MQCIRATPTLVYGSYNYLARQNGDSALASLPFFEDSRQICVLCDLYGVAILKLVFGHVRQPQLGHVRIAQSQ